LCIFSLSPAALLSFLSFFFSILFLKMEGGERGRRKESRIEKGEERRRYIRKKILVPSTAHRPTCHHPRLAVFMSEMRALLAGPKQPPKQPATPTKQSPFLTAGDNGP
jgi:hypothetical protein